MNDEYSHPFKVTEYRTSLNTWFKDTELITNPGSASEIVAASPGNYVIRLARLFVVSEPDKRSDIPGVLEACDLDGIPLKCGDDPITVPFKFGEVGPFGNEPARRFHWKLGLELPVSTRFFECQGRLALDEPKDAKPTILPVVGVEGRLTEGYRCATGSLRAVVAFDASGGGSVVGVVGSRYTVLQNDVIAQDALDFWNASWGQHVDPSTPLQVGVWGWMSYFGLCLSTRMMNGAQIRSDDDVIQELILSHSHNGKLPYRHLWMVRDPLIRSHPVISEHRIPIKHTKNVKSRSDRVAKILNEIQRELSRALHDRARLRQVAIGTEEEAMNFLQAVEQKMFGKATPERLWRLKAIVAKFFELAPRGGGDAWLLYLAASEFDQAADSRDVRRGLAELTRRSDSYKWQNIARMEWISS